MAQKFIGEARRLFVNFLIVHPWRVACYTIYGPKSKYPGLGQKRKLGSTRGSEYFSRLLKDLHVLYRSYAGDDIGDISKETWEGVDYQTLKKPRPGISDKPTGVHIKWFFLA